jgi:hypothetical protein
VEFDATAVSYAQIGIAGLGRFETDRVHVVRLAPGSYVVEAEATAQVNFSVTATGRIDYDPGLDSVLSGRGGSTLVIHGLAITIDATATNQPEFLLAGAGLHDAGRPHTVRLLPGGSAVSFADWKCFGFTVSLSGFIDYDSSLDEFLSGRGTSTLTITET